MDSTTHFLPFGNTGFTDVRQIFHDNSLGTVFNRPRHKPLRGTMQQMFGYGCFVARKPLEKPFGGTSANRLDLGFGFSDATTTGIEFPAVESKGFAVLGVGSREDTLDPGINPNDATVGFGFGNLNFIAQQQIPDSINPFEFGILPCLHRGETMVKQLCWFAPETNPFGLGKGKISFPDHWHNLTGEFAFPPAVLGFARFVGWGHMAKDRTGQLGRKVKLLAKRAVKLLVQSDAISDFGFKDLLRSPVAGSQKFFKQLVELFGFANFDLDRSGCFHHIFLFLKSLENPSLGIRLFAKGAGRQFLPEAKDFGVSLPTGI